MNDLKYLVRINPFQFETVKQLFDDGKIKPNDVDYERRTPLYYACVFNRVELIDYLLSIGGDPNLVDLEDERNVLHIAAVSHLSDEWKSEMYELLLNIPDIDFEAEDGSSVTPFYLAVIMGQHKFAKMLLDRGANIDVNQGSPLYWAVRNNYVGTARFLLDNGADPTIEVGKIPIFDLVTRRGNPKMIKLFSGYL